MCPTTLRPTEVDILNGTAPSLSVEELYVRYAPLVFRRARRFYDPHEAEEVVHEVFVRVLERFDGFRAASSPATWLFRVTTNHCLNRVRDSGRRAELLAEHWEFIPGSGSQRAGQESEAMFRELWRTLDPDLAQIGVYYHLDGMTHDDIGAVLGVSAATVRNRLKAIIEHAKTAETSP